MREIIAKSLCYGCGACEQICPTNCIFMKEDRRGFLYPKINEQKCIECGRCSEICIARKQERRNDQTPKNCCIGVHRNEDIWMKSSSGGAFSAINQVLENEDFVVFGAGYNDKNEVCHSFIRSIDDLHLLRKSKYVQSNPGNTYGQAEQFLKEGKRVIYSGTPCQIAGLYAVLGRDYDNLYTIDIVCTGVTSPLLLKKNISVLERKYGNFVKNVDMRYKVRENEEWNIGDTEVTFLDGRRIRNKVTRLYRQVYGQKVAYRDRCYSCQFAQIDRIADLTIGDWWGPIEELPEIKEHKGISLILFNSEKGKNLIEPLKTYMHLAEIDYHFAIEDNPTLGAATKRSWRCDRFWKDFFIMKDERLLRKYAKPSINVYLPWLLSRIIPAPIRNILRKQINR